MIKLRKIYKVTELAGAEKTEYKTINLWQYIHIFNSNKVTTMRKKTPKIIIYYTHYFTFSYMEYRQPQAVVSYYNQTLIH